MADRKRVVIIGAGFAGLKAARALANQPVEIVLIDRNNYHMFKPLLYQVATCGLDPSAIAYPIRSIFRKSMNVRFLLGEVTEIDTSAQMVVVNASTGQIRHESYDYLVVATGAVTNYFGNEAIERNSFGLNDLNDSIALRHHVLKLLEKAAWTDDPNERESLLTFVVVGGGPTGLETAGALHELYNNVLDVEYDKANNMDVRVILLEAQDRLLLPYPENLQKSAERQLISIGVEVRTGAFVDEVGGDYIRLKDGTRIETNTIVWATGVTGSPVAKMLNIELARGGRIPINEQMQVEALENVFAAGDITYLENPKTGQPYPGVIPVAQQQGGVIAQNILRDISGQPMKSFSYFDRGIMATIGRRRAVAWVFNRISLTGYPAWAAWLILHVSVLLGMRKRIQVLFSWIWDYFFYDRSVRIIINGADDRERHPDLFRSEDECEIDAA